MGGMPAPPPSGPARGARPPRPSPPARLRRLPPIVLLAASLSGCTLLPFGGKPTAAPGGGPSALGRGLRDFRLAFHCHSLLSHDSRVPFDEIAECAVKLGFNAVALNDHYAPGNIARSARGPLRGVLFLPGIEVRPDPSPETGKGRGSLLVFGIERDFEPDCRREELVPELRAQGAVAAAGHCEEFNQYDRYPLDAFEVYNLHEQFMRASRWGIAWRFLLYLPDPFFESQVWPSREIIARWDYLLSEGKRLAPLAGHDAHANVRLFGSWGPTIGTYPEVLRLFSNHVLAPSLERGEVLEAVRRGRVYISFDFLGDGTGFTLSYGPPPGGSAGAGGPPAILGEEAAFEASAVLAVSAPSEGRIRVLRDGAGFAEARGRSLSSPVPGPGVYRVEVDRMDRWGRDRLWILSAPIYIVGART
jgi:hypothetical protein